MYRRAHSWNIVVILALAIMLMLPASGRGQALYSYVDGSGVRVYTNIAPHEPVQDLKIIGIPAPPPQLQNLNSKTPYDPIIEKYAAQFQLNPSLLRSMISTESGFNPRAVSIKGAQGLMQLMPGTASRLGVRNAFDPDENIRGGASHMRNLLNIFNNDLDLSLAAYNAGENLVQRVGRIPNIKETHDYVQSITRKFGKRDAAYQPTSAQAPRTPPTYRYFDGNGVLHLTNIPPVPHSEPSLPLLFGPTQSPQ